MNTAALCEPELVTEAGVPYGTVVVVPALTVAAAPVEPCGPVAPVAPVAPVTPCGPEKAIC